MITLLIILAYIVSVFVSRWLFLKANFILMEWSLGDDGLDTLTVFFCFMAFINIPISVMWLIFSYLIATPPKNKFYNWFINKKNDE